MLRRLVVVALLALLSAPALAAPSACASQLLEGEAPTLINEKLAARTRELCFSGFAELHSGITRTPLWSAEHLTRTRIEAAKTVRRHNAFHAEPRLPRADR